MCLGRRRKKKNDRKTLQVKDWRPPTIKIEKWEELYQMTICKLRVCTLVQYRQPYRRCLLCVSIREGEKLVLTNNLFILSPSANRRHLRYFPPFVFHFGFHWKTDMPIFIQTLKWKDKSTTCHHGDTWQSEYTCVAVSLSLWATWNWISRRKMKTKVTQQRPRPDFARFLFPFHRENKQNKKKRIQDPVVLSRKKRKRKKKKREMKND